MDTAKVPAMAWSAGRRRCFSLVALLAAIGLAGTTQASVQDSEEQDLRVVCAATNEMVATRMEGESGEVVRDEAERHAALVTDRAELEVLVRSIQQAYNSGAVSWARIVDLAGSCDSL